MKLRNWKKIHDKFVNDIISGKRLANSYQKKGVERYLRDLKDDRYYFDTKDAEMAMAIIENMFFHEQGQTIDGKDLKGEPFLLMEWHIFNTYNLLGFKHKKTGLRKYQESFIFVPRKTAKTSWAAGLAYALSLMERKSGSKCYIIASAAMQARESFDFMIHSLKLNGLYKKARIRDNNQERSITMDFPDGGSLFIQALAANPDKQDSLNCNVVIADELHAYKTAKQYNVLKEATIAYANKLVLGITTAGDNVNSFAYQRLEYSKKVLDEVFEDEALYIFIAEADKDENGEVDFTNPKVHEMANPSYGQSVRPLEMLQQSEQAMNEPQQRKDFLAKRLNVYTAARNAYFDLDEFRKSDDLYNWGYKNPITVGIHSQPNYKELAKLNIKWYGGADLSVMHDLTAVGLYGVYNGVGIFIPHAFYPITRATAMGDDLQIPVYGWKDEGWLTFTNSNIVELTDVVSWFVGMRDIGFDIKTIGYDRYNARDFILELKDNNFDVLDIRQAYYVKSEGFRYIERKMKSQEFYYLGSQAYEYNLQNVQASEDTSSRVRYDKVHKDSKIDIFEASVFAALTYIEFELDEKNKKIDIEYY